MYIWNLPMVDILFSLLLIIVGILCLVLIIIPQLKDSSCPRWIAIINCVIEIIPFLLAIGVWFD